MMFGPSTMRVVLTMHGGPSSEEALAELVAEFRFDLCRRLRRDPGSVGRSLFRVDLMLRLLAVDRS